jgi:hypothetical protein
MPLSRGQHRGRPAMSARMAIPALAGLVAVTGAIAGCGGSAPAPSAGPSQSAVQRQTKNWLNGKNVGTVTSVVCNMPSDWKPGATFKCFVYDGTAGVGTVTNTVETSEGNQARWNEEFAPIG